MTLEEIRKQLEQLNLEHAQIAQGEQIRKTLHKGLPDEREAVKAMAAFNPELMTWDDHRRKITELEAHLIEFGIVRWEQIVQGEIITASYVLIPKNEGWLRATREGKKE